MSITRALMAAAGNAGAAVPTDPQFNYVTMLLTGDGTNGAQNNTFLDSSANNFSITRNGNTTQGSYSPYGSLWSNYFDGSSYLSYTPASGAYTFGTGDFTVEFWFNTTQTIGTIPFGFSASSNGYFEIRMDAANLYVQSSGGVTTLFSGSITSYYTKGTWAHVAVSRVSGTTRAYVNGFYINGAADSNNYSTQGSTYRIGVNSDAYYAIGYQSNLRVLKGTGLYTGTSTGTVNFIVPTTPLTAITNTTFLSLQSNRFIDNSTNAVAITASGSPSVQRFSPFNPTAAYSTATIGGSGYFDGSGDYLTLPDNTAFDFPGDFTVEAWVYLKTVSGDQGVYTSIDNGSDSWVGVTLSFSGTSFLAISYVSGNDTITHQNAVTANQWYHIAIVRNGSSTKSYLNGVQSTGTTTGTYSLTQSGGTVGSSYPGAAPLNGYISNLRVVKGTAVYTSSFTPTTTPLTAISGTSLLLNYTNAGIPDSAMMNDLETFGNAQVSTSVKKYGTGSLAFDGSDVLVSNAPLTDLCAFSTGDYTIEMWVYFVNASTLGVFYDSRPTLTNGFYPTLYVSSGNIYFYFNSANEGSAAVSTGQWYHLAVCRSSGTVKMFLNGTQSATWADTRAYSNGSGRPYVGGSGYGGGVGDGFNGYIDDLRVTKGYARYTSNFTAPTAAFPTY